MKSGSLEIEILLVTSIGAYLGAKETYKDIKKYIKERQENNTKKGKKLPPIYIEIDGELTEI